MNNFKCNSQYCARETKAINKTKDPLDVSVSSQSDIPLEITLDFSEQRSSSLVTFEPVSLRTFSNRSIGETSGAPSWTIFLSPSSNLKSEHNFWENTLSSSFSLSAFSSDMALQWQEEPTTSSSELVEEITSSASLPVSTLELKYHSSPSHQNRTEPYLVGVWRCFDKSSNVSEASFSEKSSNSIISGEIFLLKSSFFCLRSFSALLSLFLPYKPLTHQNVLVFILSPRRLCCASQL